MSLPPQPKQHTNRTQKNKTEQQKQKPICSRQHGNQCAFCFLTCTFLASLSILAFPLLLQGPFSVLFLLESPPLLEVQVLSHEPLHSRDRVPNIAIRLPGWKVFPEGQGVGEVKFSASFWLLEALLEVADGSAEIFPVSSLPVF